MAREKCGLLAVQRTVPGSRDVIPIRCALSVLVYLHSQDGVLTLKVYLHTVHDTHALQVTICSHSTDEALLIFYADTLNQMCNF